MARVVALVVGHSLTHIARLAQLAVQVFNRSLLIKLKRNILLFKCFQLFFHLSNLLLRVDSLLLESRLGQFSFVLLLDQLPTLQLC